MKYFLGTIEHLVCRKVCSKNFENRLTNKKVWPVTFLNRDVIFKNYMTGRYFFPQNL